MGCHCTNIFKNRGYIVINIDQPAVCEKPCSCLKHEGKDDIKLIVITGGPGAGKTAALEIIRKQLCQHVAILPESASIVFGGGFWRLESETAQKASQRAIFYIQREMETLALNEKKWCIGLCDRGVLDGLAYWPGSEDEFWDLMNSDIETEYKRYHSVIHLRTPTDKMGYNNINPLRTENAEQAINIDNKIKTIWQNHPHYYQIDSTPNFVSKVQSVINIVSEVIPSCCQQSK